jgi:tartrate dehydratase alpha subunit/fumarate hydratase class I-like protein
MLTVGPVQAVGEEFYKVLEDTAVEAYAMALKDIPPDVREALRRAIERESSRVGRQSVT